jgi:hypothetical protein
VRQHLQVPHLAVAPLALALVSRRPLALAVSRRRPLLTANAVGVYVLALFALIFCSHTMCAGMIDLA